MEFTEDQIKEAEIDILNNSLMTNYGEYIPECRKNMTYPEWVRYMAIRQLDIQQINQNKTQ